MKNKGWIFGIVLLSGFVGWSVWKVVLRERIPLLSYKSEVEDIIRCAQEVVEKQKPPRTDEAALKAAAVELRKRHNVLIERASDDDKRRPSYRRTDEVVMQIEWAAQSPKSEDVVKTRFDNAVQGIADVRSLLGTTQDSPQPQ